MEYEPPFFLASCTAALAALSWARISGSISIFIENNSKNSMIFFVFPVLIEPSISKIQRYIYNTNMEQNPENLLGMGAAEAKEYITGHIASLKLTEKKYGELNRDYEKWSARVGLAGSRNNEALAAEASAEAEKLRERRDALGTEIAVLKRQIERMREQLPGLAARERTIDPDLLEQELLIALGYMPGDETVTGKAARKRPFEELDADAALEELKAKMRQDDTA
jgi:hypothetical protein